MTLVIFFFLLAFNYRVQLRDGRRQNSCLMHIFFTTHLHASKAKEVTALDAGVNSRMDACAVRGKKQEEWCSVTARQRRQTKGRKRCED
ncbi:uncharacterized protein IWZ02DRAFT_12743 [Phyllosticta citriasiana]|uniref:uncharacterized protein n=1 Tax=Phyllosticta citriasiana TaxID=595635 RepID=UPI0030FD3B44